MGDDMAKNAFAKNKYIWTLVWLWHCFGINLCTAHVRGSSKFIQAT
jgi:hypothetical protein